MKLFIGCSSSNDIDSKYLDDSYLLLNEILKDNDLVYGAYNNGIMKIAYSLAHHHNRKIIAITTDKYKDELGQIECEYKESTPNIYTRSELLVRLSDMVIILPGGIGTINELISSIETMRNNEFNKPILIYNMDGFFDKFLEFLDKVYEEKFSSIDAKKYYHIVNTREDVIEYVNEYKESQNGRKN